MINNDDTVQALREALRVSPENIPLRQHLAETLLSLGRFDEAETEMRQALSQAPNSAELKIALAQIYHRGEKYSHAMVIVEDLVKQPSPAAAALLLHARLLLRTGDIPFAVSQYKLAIETDPAVEDADLSEELGITSFDDEPDPDAEIVDGRMRAGWEPGGESSIPELERPTIRFEDVGGMEGLKEEIRMKIIYPLQHREMFEAYGKPIGGGILLYGPPGCGKTHLARATAGEIDASFISVGISDVLDMWIGSSERRLHELFEHARRNTPCVLFFDEVDALGASRSDMRQSSGKHLINQFLAELDGIDGDNDGVLILAATNSPWHLDSAFRRPGRFDRILFVPPPDAVARAEILRIHSRGKPSDNLDCTTLAKKTSGFSGADLKVVFDVAIEEKLRSAMSSGKLEALTTKDLIRASKSRRPSTKEWFSTARNYALYSNEGGLYDDILDYMNLK